jgi:parallel beta-helix repeat protein/predicted outer membrane repeat protein
MKKIFFLIIVMIFLDANIKAQTHIDQNYFSANLPTYTWNIAGSPYEIIGDIEIHNGSNLIIEPGVSVVFQGHYKMDVKGSINAIGTVNERIVITSDDKNPWNGIRFDFSDGTTPTPSKLYYCDISNAQKTGTDCQNPDPESSGGAIYVESFSPLEIIDCEIFNNSVQAHGGAIALFENSSPLIRNNSIHNNFALKRGGGIAMFRDCDPDVINNKIYRNEAKKGGGGIAIGVLNNYSASCSPNIQDNTITDNLVSGYQEAFGGWYGDGGGVFICHSSPILNHNVFERNSAYINGGGICIQRSSNVIIEYNDFKENQAIVDGGGIYLTSNSIATLNDCFFANNSSVNGGGINVYQGELHAINCTFTENTASTDGGAIYVLNSTSDIENCTFVSNTATGNGGGVYMNDPVSNTISLNTFSSNEAYDGSAIFYFRDYTNINLYYQNQTKIINNLIIMNYANHRGSVYFSDNNTNTIFNHNTVTNNTSSTSISGLVVDKKDYFPDLTANSCNFNNNIVYGNTNVIYIVTATPLEWSYFLMDIYASPNCTYVTNPGFVSSNDYHLSSSSTCIDAGNNNALMTTSDLDGNQRINNGTTDYGCFEY